MECTTCTELVRSKPLNAVINLTNNCNLRCEYCFVDFAPERSTLEVAKAACEYLLKDTKEKPNLWFFGGEPLLELESIIKPIVLEYGDRMSFGITTNGVLLNMDAVDFLHKHNISLLLSIDGAAEVQNHQRTFPDGSASFAAVVKNIPYLLLYYPDVTFRSTLTKFSIPRMMNTYKFARHMGFKNIAFCINEYEEYDNIDQELLTANYNAIAREILAGSPLWLSDLDNARDYWQVASAGKEMGSVYRCGYGTTSVGIDVKGNLLPCQELNSGDGTFIIGDVFTGIDTEKHNDFLKMAFQPSDVPNTFSGRFLQAGLCPKKQYADHNFTVSNGRKIQLEAMQAMYGHFHKLTAFSANSYYRRISR